MRRVAVLAALTAAVLAVPAVPAATGTEEPPTGVEVTYGDEVPVITRWHVSEAVARAWSYFADWAARELSARIIVVADPEAAVTAWAEARNISRQRARRQLTARSGYYAGLAITGLTVIINRGDGPGPTAHEFVHLVQHEVCACDSQGPRWLSEGAAEYFANDIEHEWGIRPALRSPRIENRKIAEEWNTLAACRAGHIPDDGETCRWAEAPLSDLERPGAFDLAGGAVGAYDRARVAFQRLVDVTTTGAYRCYLEEQARRAPWRAAFESCFGRSPAQFYAEFDAYRDHGFIGAAVAGRSAGRPV